VALLLLTAATPSLAMDQIVYPTGVFPTDVQNVQAAVDQGGAVLLKATDAGGNPTAFNFGPPVVGSGRVFLTRDVEVRGEQPASGVTTIRGGSLPFLGQAATKTVIRGIRFEAPLRGAVWFLGPPEADTEVVGNTVTGVVGRFFACCGTTAEAILVQGGRVRIAGNVVEDIESEQGIGISQFFSAGLVEIVENRVSGTNLIGIESTGNEGAVRILDNVLRPGCCGSGIEINGTGSYLVARNDIVVQNPGASGGILAFGTEEFGFGPLNGVTIEKNDIRLQPSEIGEALGTTGVALGGIAFDTYIGQNKIEGDALAAFYLYDSFEPTAEIGFTTLVGNNIAHVHSTCADVFLSAVTHDTVLKGNSGTVIDLGTNNSITGFSQGGSGGGQQVSEANKRRGEALKAAHGASHAWSSAGY
jgi:hypothetical protein